MKTSSARLDMKHGFVKYIVRYLRKEKDYFSTHYTKRKKFAKHKPKSTRPSAATYTIPARRKRSETLEHVSGCQVIDNNTNSESNGQLCDSDLLNSAIKDPGALTEHQMLRVSEILVQRACCSDLVQRSGVISLYAIIYSKEAKMSAEDDLSTYRITPSLCAVLRSKRRGELDRLLLLQFLQNLLLTTVAIRSDITIAGLVSRELLNVIHHSLKSSSLCIEVVCSTLYVTMGHLAETCREKLDRVMDAVVRSLENESDLHRQQSDLHRQQSDLHRQQSVELAIQQYMKTV